MGLATQRVLYAGCLPGTPFRELVAAAAGAGFDALTLWPNIWYRALSREGLTPVRMRGLLDDAGLVITDLDPLGDWLPPPPAGAPPSPFRNDMTRSRYFDIAAVLGARRIIAVHLDTGEVDRAAAVDGFGTLCDDAAHHGLDVALECMPFSGIPDLATAWDIVGSAGRANGGVAFDIAHHVRGGGDDAALARIPADRIALIQISDGPATPPDDLVEEARFGRRLPGSGDFDVVRRLRVLAARGVRAPVGAELYLRGWSERPADDVATDLRAALDSVLRAVDAPA